MMPIKVTFWRPQSVPDGAAWPRGAVADAIGTRKRPDVTAAGQKRNRGAPSRGDGNVDDARQALGTACVRARARTAPAPAGAPTRRVGDGAPPTGMAKFSEADPPDWPRRGHHGDRRSNGQNEVFVVGVGWWARRQLVNNVVDSRLT